MLNRGSAEFVRQGRQHLFPSLPLVGKHPELDQTVSLQGGVRFLANGIGQAICSDEHHGVQVMGVGAQAATFGGRQQDGWHPLIIDSA